jgi:hypothetical protein
VGVDHVAQLGIRRRVEGGTGPERCVPSGVELICVWLSAYFFTVKQNPQQITDAVYGDIRPLVQGQRRQLRTASTGVQVHEEHPTC